MNAALVECGAFLARRRCPVHHGRMFIHPHSLSLEFGPARLLLTPPLPPVWLSLARQAPGPASLCLALLPLSHLAWEGVAGPQDSPASPNPAACAALPAGLLPRLLEALCPPWLSTEEEAELAGLERYIQARADFPGLDCAACREQEQRGEGAPDCARCPRPRPPVTSQAALGLWPLLRAWPPGLAFWAGPWLAGLPPREAWRLAWRLAVLARGQGRGSGPSCPLLEGRASI